MGRLNSFPKPNIYESSCTNAMMSIVLCATDNLSAAKPPADVLNVDAIFVFQWDSQNHISAPGSRWQL